MIQFESNLSKFDKYVMLADHYIAIGQKRIWCNTYEQDFPYELVDKIESKMNGTFCDQEDFNLLIHHECGLVFVCHFGLSGIHPGNEHFAGHMKNIKLMISKMKPELRNQLLDKIHRRFFTLGTNNKNDLETRLKNVTRDLELLETL